MKSCKPCEHVSVWTNSYNQTVGRCLDLFDIDVGIVKRWRTGPGHE
jgi:3-polyprenyl-4-hydroxybenzoate decarboxylase